MKRPSLLYILLTFLKLGATAFGGYMSLVAMVQKQIVDQDKMLDEEDLLDGISLTSVLPGPVAVNVIAYVGYKLRGIAGACIAFVGIILPSFFLVLFLSWFYMKYGNVPAVKSFFMGIMPAVTAMILTVAVGMAKKTIKEKSQWIVCIVSALLLAIFGGFVMTLAIIVVSGIIGYWLYDKKDTSVPNDAPLQKNISQRQWLVSGVVLLALLCLLIFGGTHINAPIIVQILSTFSGTSLTLFGGGYVVIPALHELFVNNLGWLTSSQFADGIAIGQVTPGPIFITATFIGYRVAGFLGATAATVAMFTPPAVLTVLLSNFTENIKQSQIVKAAMKGVRAAVIGMIFASAITIGQTVKPMIGTIALFVVILIVSYKYKVSPVYLILGSGIIGFLLF